MTLILAGGPFACDIAERATLFDTRTSGIRPSTFTRLSAIGATGNRVGGTAIIWPSIVIDLAANCAARWLTDLAIKIDRGADLHSHSPFTLVAAML
ncbi:MAG: hypothetical protein KGK01_10515 [Bradyrhizobium sp.]|nr:hypothetical protein [Bradyrhizobium sp.]MDE2472875.1 hypothetical protein [Bradyrhizobium sp.]